MKKYILCLIAGSFLFSCSKFLEPKSESEYVPKTAAALNEMLIGNAYPRPDVSNPYIDTYHGVFDDDMTCNERAGTFDYINGWYAVRLQAMYSWQPDVFRQLSEANLFKNVWEGHYQYILGANAALDYIDGVSGSTDEKNHVKAQALALRAYFYFDLVNMFGAPYNHDKKALGVPLKKTSALEALELPRNTVEEVYTLILDDLDEAERLYESLPGELQYKADFRTNLPMVQLLKSRVYLYMENWKESARYASKVITDWPQFELKNLNSITTTTSQPYFPFISNQNNKDCVWFFGCVNEYLDILNLKVGYPNPANQKSNLYRYFFMASSDLLDKYEDGDLRKKLYFIRDKNDAGMDPLPARAIGKHVTGSDSLPINTGDYFARAFRLSEAYLNLAEAAAMDNDPETALTALNGLREKRFEPTKYVALTGLSGDALIERIRLERRLELCFEGHRWFDLRRYGMPEFSRVWRMNGVDVKTYTLREKDPFYTWPIPEVVMEKNRKLVQNHLSAPRN